MSNGTAPAPEAYEEPHSALNWPLLVAGLFAPALAELACLFLGIAVSQPWFFVIMGWLFVPGMISASMLYRNWPTGIRLDATGITIGAVHSPGAARRRPTVNHQARGLFTCPWSQVRAVRVVTDPAELRQIKDSPLYTTFTNRWGTRRPAEIRAAPGRPSGMEKCELGVLTSPFMRAALVIDLDLGMIEASQVRPARYFSNFVNGRRFSRLIHPEMSPTWIVPTRDPGNLSKALEGFLKRAPWAADAGGRV